MAFPSYLLFTVLTVSAEASPDPDAYGYMDVSGKVVLAPQFSSDGNFAEGRAVVAKDGKWHLIDAEGKVLKSSYRMGWTLAGGRLAFQMTEDGPWGYLDRDGKVVVEPRFDDANSFSDGFAAVKVEGSYGYIDTLGNWVIKPQYRQVGPFSEGLAQVMKGKPPAAFIDREGKEVFHAGSKLKSLPFRNGYTCVGGYAIYDRTGKRVPHPPIDGCREFEGGYAPVDFRDTAEAGGTHGLIDTAGRVVFKGRYRNMGWYRNGLVPVVVSVDECHYLDSTGKIRIQGEEGKPFMNCRPFQDGYAVVQPYRRNYGLIDTTGRFVLPPVYKVLNQGEGLLSFKPGDGVGTLNSEKTGTMVGLLAERGIVAGLPGDGGADGMGGGRYVAWKLIRPGTAAGRGSRMLEYAVVSLKSRQSFSQIESAIRWRTRMGWIQENVGLEPLEGGKDAESAARRAALGPGYNHVKNVTARSLGAFDL